MGWVENQDKIVKICSKRDAFSLPYMAVFWSPPHSKLKVKSLVTHLQSRHQRIKALLFVGINSPFWSHSLLLCSKVIESLNPDIARQFPFHISWLHCPQFCVMYPWGQDPFFLLKNLGSPSLSHWRRGLLFEEAHNCFYCCSYKKIPLSAQLYCISKIYYTNKLPSLPIFLESIILHGISVSVSVSQGHVDTLGGTWNQHTPALENWFVCTSRSMLSC